ncbi:MAG: methylmalonyl-CoA mutase small subunit [Bacteroidota bacterium]|nr:methylmalonyl-CoA mutase small subunit [Bacteroidota bacterium]
MADSKQKLFTEFAPVSTEAWMNKVTADLKGADFDKKLVWKTNEGFSVKPMYRAEDIEGMAQTTSLPGEFPYVRGTKADNKWFVRQEIEVENIEAANAKALDILNKGVDSLGFVIDSEDVSAENIAKLLKDICVECIELNFKTCACASVELAKILADYFASANVDLAKVKGSLNFDPIGRELARGKQFEEAAKAYAEMIDATKALPNFRVLAVNAAFLNNAGAYSYQELGFALAWGNEVLTQAQEAGLDVVAVAKNIKFNFGVGSNYFMEIAKFRAARMLWANIVKSYTEDADAAKMVAHAVTSDWNMTIFDAHVNMLRTQTEAMSAALAGVDSITVNPFDKTYQESDEFSERIARNQQLLLKEESHFEKIVDPSAGSYYIEHLTASIAKQAWTLFLDVEEKGGFLAAVKAGTVQDTVNNAGTARRAAIAARKEVLLGSNQFPNFNEKAAAKIKTSAQDCGCDAPAAKVLDFTRGASEFEALRLATEKAAKRPKAFMLTIGNLAMRLARAQFSCNFLACAGYEVVDNLGFETVEAGVEAAKAAGADIIVLCSSDDEYAELAPKAKAAIGGAAILVVAGAPACAEDLKAQGITEFINVRTNVLGTLTAFSKQLGILK